MTSSTTPPVRKLLPPLLDAALAMLSHMSLPESRVSVCMCVRDALSPLHEGRQWPSQVAWPQRSHRQDVHHSHIPRQWARNVGAPPPARARLRDAQWPIIIFGAFSASDTDLLLLHYQSMPHLSHKLVYITRCPSGAQCARAGSCPNQFWLPSQAVGDAAP